LSCVFYALHATPDFSAPVISNLTDKIPFLDISYKDAPRPAFSKRLRNIADQAVLEKKWSNFLNSPGFNDYVSEDKANQIAKHMAIQNVGLPKRYNNTRRLVKNFIREFISEDSVELELKDFNVESVKSVLMDINGFRMQEKMTVDEFQRFIKGYIEFVTEHANGLVKNSIGKMLFIMGKALLNMKEMTFLIAAKNALDDDISQTNKRARDTSLIHADDDTNKRAKIVFNNDQPQIRLFRKALKAIYIQSQAIV